MLMSWIVQALLLFICHNDITNPARGQKTPADHGVFAQEAELSDRKPYLTGGETTECAIQITEASSQ